jgi:hypothetical protein
MNIVKPIASQPVVESNGTMADPFRLWTQRITDLQILTGSGSPEGVVSAPITTLYMNTAGTAGSILYIKRDTDISADPTRGWILV